MIQPTVVPPIPLIMLVGSVFSIRLVDSAWVAFEVETRTRNDFLLQFRRPRGPVFAILIMDHLFLCMSMTSRQQHVTSVSSILGDPVICSQHPGLR